MKSKYLAIGYLLIISIVTLISCSKEEIGSDNNVAYYKFSTDDYSHIPIFTLNQKIVYKNQFEESLKFTVSTINESKILYTVGMGFFTSYAASYFNYDIKQIILSPDNDDNAFPLFPLSYDFRRWPLDLELAKVNYKTLCESSLLGEIILFEKLGNSRWVGYDEYSEVIALEINEVEYENVKVFKSLNSSESNETENITLKVVYYTDRNGVIGFDDVNGKLWRKQ